MSSLPRYYFSIPLWIIVQDNHCSCKLFLYHSTTIIYLMHSPKIKYKVLELRKNGTSLGEISDLLGINSIEALTIISELESVSGRFQHFTSKEGITAIVDYAHTPDALKNVLETINIDSNFFIN